MSTSTSSGPRTAAPAAPSRWSSLGRTVLTQRVVLLAVLVVAVVAVFTALDLAGRTSGPYNPDYLAGSLINVVPTAMLGLAELLVIVSGRGGIDLSVGAMVSLVGMGFGFCYGLWGWPLWAAVPAAVLGGAVLGAVNGLLVAHLRFPALIATLATYYAYKSIAIVVNDQQPINSPRVQDLYATARSVELPLIGAQLPLFPLGVVLFLLPTVVLVWYVVDRSPYGRRLFAIGTNDVAATWAGIGVAATRFWAYAGAGAICGLVAVVTVGQFASARPDAGTSGNGMALPAITIAVLAGVAITGGIGRVSGVVLAAVLVAWLNAGVLLTFPGNSGTRLQLLALGLLLVLAALFNGWTNRRYRVVG
ncbi:ABC transporter permease [Kineococcus arenarius]|uniref:ABC transporter permease n=1 Tax=Kineococcus sp. SYSU DK007 TaxID=3383128 RepID=UPI003D7DC9EB